MKERWVILLKTLKKRLKAFIVFEILVKRRDTYENDR